MSHSTAKSSQDSRRSSVFDLSHLSHTPFQKFRYCRREVNGHLFGILYLQVKFMKTIPGTALVEMGDEYAVERAVTHLNNVKLFGKRLNVW